MSDGADRDVVRWLTGSPGSAPAQRGGRLFGDTHPHGTDGVHFFTRGQVITSRWPDPRHS